MKRLSPIFIFLFAVVFHSCKREPFDPVISCSPSDLVLEANGGDLIEFTVRAHGEDSELRNVVITQKPIGGITTTLLDTSVYGKDVEFFFVYAVPAGVDEVFLSFNVYDSEGNSGATHRTIYIEGNELMGESSGHELFSPFAFGAVNAYNISSITGIQLDVDPDSTLIDLIEGDDSNDETLSLTLKSLSGIKFVRNNSFNYAEATALSASDNFTSSSQLQLMPNIQVNDILITEFDTILHQYAVIKIMGITDAAGTNEDKYTFNLKK